MALVLERVDWQQTVIAEMSSDDIVALASSTELDAATRHALDELVHRRQALADAEAAQHALAGEVQAIGSDQQRIRANLQGLGRDSGLYKRYVDKLAEQETRLEKLQTQIAAAAAQGRAAKTALDQYIDGLRL